MLSLEKNNNLQFNKQEYDYFIENCGFNDDEKEILDLRRSGKSIVEISIIKNTSISTINRNIKRIKKKIISVIKGA